MKLIIAEKRSAGEKVAACIGENFQSKKGYLQSPHYIISWCAGHLYELWDLEEYESRDENEKKGWTLDNLPFCPPDNHFRYKVKSSKKDPALNTMVKSQIAVLKSLINSDQVDAIYHCGDADREGEVIVRNALRALLKTSKPVYRIWLKAYSPKDVQDALKSRDPDSNYEGWDQSGLARAYQDWLFGINGTRYLSIKGKTLLPWGRCKYIITKAIVDREREIQNFVPKKYLALVSAEKTKDFEFCLTSKITFDPADASKAQELADRYNQAGAYISHVAEKNVTVAASPLFSTTSLQAYISSNFKDFDPKDVEQALEDLYQNGYTTYPRTNTTFLTKSDEEDIDRTIASLVHQGFTAIINKKGNKKIYNDDRVDGHSALTPTSKIPGNLSEVEKAVYESIRNRFLAVFCSEDRIDSKTTLTIQCSDEEFSVTGSINVQKGWLQYEAANKKDRYLPKMKEGDKINVHFSPVEKQTTPPKRFTVESFGNWCVTPWKSEKEMEQGEYSSDDWKRILHEATICTDATRTPTITACRQCGYITLTKGVYKPCDKGFQFIDACEALGLTFSVMEVMELSSMLFDVRKGNMSIDECLAQAKQKLNRLFAHRDVEIQSMDDRTEVCPCPICHSPLLGSNKAYFCSNRSCGFIIAKKSKLLERLGGRKKAFTDEDIRSLVSGHPIVLRGCTSQKTGRHYDCQLALDFSQNPPKFFFPSYEESSESVGKCPVCGSNMVEHSMTFSCENKSCGFCLFKESKRFNDVIKIDEKKARALLTGKSISAKLTNKAGEKYTAKIVLHVREYNNKKYPSFDLMQK